MPEHDEADRSASTAQFRAFVDQAGGPETTQAWTMAAPRNRVLMLTAIVLGVAVVLALIAVLVIG
jgi:multisubunit Na+/H+ antiporter MnhC subunit